MNYLLDTHVFLWLISEPEKLSKKVFSILENSKSKLYFSTASSWEIVIKYKLGKIKLENPKVLISNELAYYKISVLTINLEHVFQLLKLKPIHKDPFDRILISQAINEKMTFISNDIMIKKYPLKIIW